MKFIVAVVLDYPICKIARLDWLNWRCAITHQPLVGAAAAAVAAAAIEDNSSRRLNVQVAVELGQL